MILYILNLFDLCFTLHAISRGAAELNPLMRNIPFMVAWKVLGIGFLCWLLNHFANGGNMVARRGLKICTAAFAAVNLWHIANL
jgi:hypothetical protein